MSDDEQSKIASRIRNLLELAEDPSATENEAAVAQKKAEKLMGKHSMSEMDIRTAEYEVQKVYFDGKSEFPGWYKIIASALSDFLGVYVIYATGHGRPHDAYWIVGGREQDITEFEYMAEALYNKVFYLAADWADRKEEETGERPGRKSMNAYRVGVTQRLYERLREMVTNVSERQKGADEGLILADEVEKKKREAEKKVKSDHVVGGTAAAASSGDRAAQAEGFQEGDRVGLNRGVDTGDGNGRKGLTS